MFCGLIRADREFSPHCLGDCEQKQVRDQLRGDADEKGGGGKGNYWATGNRKRVITQVWQEGLFLYPALDSQFSLEIFCFCVLMVAVPDSTTSTEVGRWKRKLPAKESKAV